jgi:hypothetical protein
VALTRNDAFLAVSRFCSQLRREGYRVEHELVEDVHIVSAYEPGGRAVARSIGCTTEDGFCIEELQH